MSDKKPNIPTPKTDPKPLPPKNIPQPNAEPLKEEKRYIPPPPKDRTTPPKK